jgi:two-component system response regulator LytT
MKVVIIEDEIITANGLKNIILECRDTCSVSAILSSVKQSKIYLNANRDYDLIFADVDLGDGTCFDIFKDTSINSPVIFCTGHDKYRQQAFDENGIGYILKPFDQEKVKNAIDKYDRLFSKSHELDGLQKVLNSINNFAGREHLLFTKIGGQTFPIALKDIAIFQLNSSGIVVAHTFSDKVFETDTLSTRYTSKEFKIDESLEDITRIEPDAYFRANRQMLISRRAVKSFKSHEGQRLLVTPALHIDNHPIIISKEKSTEFKDWLRNN